MNSYFTVDRKKSLRENQIIDLIQYDDVKPPELQKHIDLLFPDGVTNHGELYMVRGKTPANGINQAIELIFEYVRRSHFPLCPSRFQSIFAHDNIDQAIKFRDKYGKSDSVIWEIESDSAFKADMRLLTFEGSVLVLSYNAHRYWKGIPSGNDPIWEFLIVPPLKVVHRID